MFASRVHPSVRLGLAVVAGRWNNNQLIQLDDNDAEVQTPTHQCKRLVAANIFRSRIRIPFKTPFFR